MMMASSSTPTLPASTEPAAAKDSSNNHVETTHRMRITSGGSVAFYVRFALLFLSENPNVPLVLHTLPPDPSQITNEKGNGTSSVAESSSNLSNSKSKSTLAQCTLTTSKLISIVEKIKREYLLAQHKDYQRQQQQQQSKGGESIAIDTKGKGKGKGKGIWQYTESGLYHPPPSSSSSVPGLDVANSTPLIRVLDGRTKPKITHHPYLQITLSLLPLPLLDGKYGVTSQYSAISRSNSGRGSKSRSKLKSKSSVAKATEDENENENEDARPDPVPAPPPKEQLVARNMQGDGEQAKTKSKGEKRKSSSQIQSQSQSSTPVRPDKKRKT